MTLEPHNQPWLFALDAPAGLPVTSEFTPRVTADMRIVTTDLVRQRLRYEMRSFTSYRFNADAGESERRNWLDLPPTYNRRTLALAEEIRTRSGNDADRVRATLEHLRRGGYAYTLSPPRLGRDSIDEFLFDTRRGYCEHYASAFVFLMRALDVPARVVTGYQGGELNPVDGFMTIRQSDAHAWSEVWLQGRGWVRVDPTATVCDRCASSGASDRTAAVSLDAAPPALHGCARRNWERCKLEPVGLCTAGTAGDLMGCWEWRRIGRVWEWCAVVVTLCSPDGRFSCAAPEIGQWEKHSLVGDADRAV